MRFLFILLAVLLVSPFARADDLPQDEEISTPYISPYVVKYVGQRTFSCGDVTVKIPSYFPSSKFPQPLFLSKAIYPCTRNGYSVELSSTDNCDRNVDCFRSEFGRWDNTADPQADLIEKSLRVFAEKVELGPHTIGYLLPVSCNFRCDDTQEIVWQLGPKTYYFSTISTGNPEYARNELIKAAKIAVSELEREP